MPKAYTRRSPEQWQQILSEQQSSGLSQEQFCKQEYISYGTFQTWRKRLNQLAPEAGPAFVEVPRSESSAASLPLDSGLRVRLELGAGVVLELSRT